jgi:hypothetical protein
MSEVIVSKQDVNLVISESEDNSVVVSPSTVSSVTINTRGPQGPGGVMGLYGSFIDTTDQPLVSTTAAPLRQTVALRLNWLALIKFLLPFRQLILAITLQKLISF